MPVDFGPLAEIYYDPQQGLSSTPAKLRSKALEKGYTYSLDSVKQFIAEQQTHQRYFNRKRLKYYSIVDDADAPFERIQVDLLDMIDQLPNRNGGFRYLFITCDCYSRYITAVPIKTKTTRDCVSALQVSLDWISTINGFLPQRIDSDNEPAFMSGEYKNELKENDIIPHYSQIGDHKSLAFVDAACRNVRLILGKFLESPNGGVRWLETLPQLIFNLNNSVMSSIGCTPTQVIEDDSEKKIDINNSLDKSRNKQDDRAMKQDWAKQPVVVGSQVRILLPPGAAGRLSKKTVPKFSSELHTVTRIVGRSFYYIDNSNDHKYRLYELLLVNPSFLPIPDPETIPSAPSRAIALTEQQQQSRKRRRIAHEGFLPHQYSGPGGPDNSLEARYHAEVNNLPSKRSRN